MQTTLLIMAAGIGSRFGGGIKQLEPVDETGHIIMDYSIHDAIEAGFNKVVFIIRKDIENEFKEVIGDRIAGICSEHNVTVDYAFQDINDIPGVLPEGRTKPWGTGQAVLAAKDVLTTPFIVINADDYYGKEGFRAVHEYLVNGGQSCMAGFVLKNTLSDNGGVTRGICKMDAENNLTEVVETKNIIKTTEGAEISNIKMDAYTYILEESGERFDHSDIHMNSVIGINTGTENMVWLKPYKKAPRMQAERAYKKRDYKEFVVIRKSYGDKTLSESVKYVISLKNTDINGNMSWETIFAIPLEKSILLNKTICGYNAINYSGKTSCGKLKKIICKQFGIDSDAIFIEKI